MQMAFNRSYNGNRAPIGVYLHGVDLQKSGYQAGIISFLVRTVCKFAVLRHSVKV